LFPSRHGFQNNGAPCLIRFLLLAWNFHDASKLKGHNGTPDISMRRFHYNIKNLFGWRHRRGQKAGREMCVEHRLQGLFKEGWSDGVEPVELENCKVKE
jgi:hypothetical protein